MSGGGGAYGWYYMTQARFQTGGQLWDAWNDKMLPLLIKQQAEDGHWDCYRGAVMSTTLCCLCLEVYYRYLPTYARQEEVNREPQTKEEEDIQVGIRDAL